jgi:hypothetical protein
LYGTPRFGLAPPPGGEQKDSENPGRAHAVRCLANALDSLCLEYVVLGRRPPQRERIGPRTGRHARVRHATKATGDWVRTLYCCACGVEGRSEAAHTGSDVGMSMKRPLPVDRRAGHQGHLDGWRDVGEGLRLLLLAVARIATRALRTPATASASGRSNVTRPLFRNAGGTLNAGVARALRMIENESVRRPSQKPIPGRVARSAE